MPVKTVVAYNADDPTSALQYQVIAALSPMEWMSSNAVCEALPHIDSELIKRFLKAATTPILTSRDNVAGTALTAGLIRAEGEINGKVYQRTKLGDVFLRAVRNGQI